MILINASIVHNLIEQWDNQQLFDIIHAPISITALSHASKEKSIIVIMFMWVNTIFSAQNLSFRGKKITCPGARDKLNFRQDKHILRTSKKITDSLFFLDKDKLFGNRTSKYFDVLARGTSENF